MSVLMFFNELSCVTPCTKDEVSRAMAGFVDMTRLIVRWRSDAALVSEVKLKELELAPGFYLAEWMGHPAHRDQGRWIRAMQNRAPFKAVLTPGAEEGTDYFWQGGEAKALRAAHLEDGLLVSLLIDPLWSASWVEGRRMVLSENQSGEPEIQDEAVEVRHAATEGSAKVHEEWIKRAGVSGLSSGAEIWNARATVFPNLRFLPRTEEHLRRLETAWVIPVRRELQLLQATIAEWRPEGGNKPVWRSKVTGDSDTNKQFLWFDDFDETIQLFHLHGRFTPSAGRYYFRLVPAEGVAVIAHIGHKPPGVH